MEPIVFKVTKGEVTKEFNIRLDETIEVLKEKIKHEYNVESYIDIEFKIDKPMRILGKFNVEPGILARTFDRYELNKFGIKGDININLTFHEIDNYRPFKSSNNRVLNLKKYSGERGDISLHEVFTPNGILEGFKADINSHDDFPSLGS